MPTEQVVKVKIIPNGITVFIQLGDQVAGQIIIIVGGMTIDCFFTLRSKAVIAVFRYNGCCLVHPDQAVQGIEGIGYIQSQR